MSKERGPNGYQGLGGEGSRCLVGTEPQLGDEKVLETERGWGCTALCVTWHHGAAHLKMAKEVNFTLCALYHNFKKKRGQSKLRLLTRWQSRARVAHPGHPSHPPPPSSVRILLSLWARDARLTPQPPLHCSPGPGSTVLHPPDLDHSHPSAMWSPSCLSHVSLKFSYDPITFKIKSKCLSILFLLLAIYFTGILLKSELLQYCLS